MKLVFFVVAAAMVVAALALLLVPLVRHGRREGRSRGVFALALAIAFVLPLAAAGLYLEVGAPVTLDGVPAAQPSLDVDQALAELRDHLRQQPDDLQGWLLLAQTESALHHGPEARAAYDQALRIDPHNGTAMVGWAEADSMARQDHLIEGRALDLLNQAVQADPANQRGLWLLGISQFQHDRYAEAAATWRRLLPLLEPGSTVAKAVTEQIAVADARAGGTPAPAAAPASAGPRLTVEVALAPGLRDRLVPGATLFVYARAESGPPMPLAVARLDAGKLPASVTLTDAMAMTPQRTLSSADKVFVGARISASGQAIAQPGDLEGDAGVVPVERTAPVRIVIDKVHP
ncbi:tetratricopeptide repeat protein [Fulvimonas yonginensis]|uniref:Tetratricopeptide repeat protein n=1 Tax=Fulvimonas yonginensis TaxID=1495200 RepID=A0ABU8JFL6_9GAMM